MKYNNCKSNRSVLTTSSSYPTVDRSTQDHRPLVANIGTRIRTWITFVVIIRKYDSTTGQNTIEQLQLTTQKFLHSRLDLTSHSCTLHSCISHSCRQNAGDIAIIILSTSMLEFCQIYFLSVHKQIRSTNKYTRKTLTFCPYNSNIIKRSTVVELHTKL